MRRVFPILLFLVVGLAAPAIGEMKPDVLLVAADADYGIESVQSYLAALGMFDAVDTFDAWHDTPESDLLDEYCSVLVWSNAPFEDAVTLGDRLADYVDTGGSVVLASMALMGGSPAAIEGRILGYSPLQPTGGNAFELADMGWCLPWHPIMAGVDELSGYYRDKTELAPGALLVALWDDALPLAAVGENKRVVALAMFPNDEHGFQSGDYPQLFGNALYYACIIPEPGLLTVLGLSLVLLAARRRT